MTYTINTAIIKANLNYGKEPIVMRYSGVTAKGIITPIFKFGDDLIEGIVGSLLKTAENEKFDFNDGDIVGVTEAL
ncbi:MAG TPA: hypothetical protein PLZ27_06115, partial [Bacillota bacterium]|nr:hypothetical protein [Bacillota bacterium]